MALFNILKGIKVLEFGGLAPGPLCGKILSDYGASVVKIEKPTATPIGCIDVNKQSVIIDMKLENGYNIAKKLCLSSDVIIDPFRPGVLEKIGLGPNDIMKDNPQVVFARLTGFGQTGPLSKVAGHDINYVGYSGVLSMLGHKQFPPIPPINLLADFAGGGVMCAFGVVLALFNRDRIGKGQVVDSSMTEGAAYVSSWIYSTKNTILFHSSRGENLLDGGVHFYGSYETKDGKYMSVGAIEPQFYKRFLEGLDLNPSDFEQTTNSEENKEVLKRKFKEKTQSEWCKIFEYTDSCVSPVLNMDEAPLHPHNKDRNNFSKFENNWLPAPSPLISTENGERYPHITNTPYVLGRDTRKILLSVGYSDKEIKNFINDGCVIDTSSNI